MTFRMEGKAMYGGIGGSGFPVDVKFVFPIRHIDVEVQEINIFVPNFYSQFDRIIHGIQTVQKGVKIHETTCP